LQCRQVFSAAHMFAMPHTHMFAMPHTHMFAMSAGILGSGFLEVYEERKAERRRRRRRSEAAAGRQQGDEGERERDQGEVALVAHSLVGSLVDDSLHPDDGACHPDDVAWHNGSEDGSASAALHSLASTVVQMESRMLDLQRLIQAQTELIQRAIPPS
jgi:hypothetical protein